MTTAKTPPSSYQCRHCGLWVETGATCPCAAVRLAEWRLVNARRRAARKRRKEARQ